MEVYRRSSGLLLLLGLFLLATTLQGVQGEAESEGPSESECRPYIEKALKELETGEHAGGSSETGESKEDIPTVEVTDDSDNQDGEGDNDSNEGQKNTEGVEEEVEKQPPEPEIRLSFFQRIPILSKFFQTAKKPEAAPEDKSSESKLDDVNQEQQDQAAVDDNKSDETDKESREGETESIEEQAEDDGSKEKIDDEVERKTSIEDDGGATEDKAENEGDDQSEQKESNEDHDTTKISEPVEQVESTEQQQASEASQEEQVENQAESQEDQTESDENQAKVQQQVESEEDQVENKRVQPESEENESKDEQDDNQRTTRSVKEKEDNDESVEEQVTETSKEEDLEEFVEKDEQSKEDVIESVKKENDSKESEVIKDDVLPDISGESGEGNKNESVEEASDTAGDKDDSKEDDTKEKSEESKIDGKDDDTEEQTDSKEDSADGDSGENDKNKDDDDASDETEESGPVEDLSLDVEVPSELRSRDHVEQLLKLDDRSSDTESIIDKVSEITLKGLKKLYENAIKPLEVLYRYRDLSNRHFGDAEIFSKPLILFMGPWSGGKSSIINYLVNNEYNETSLRTGAEPSPAYFNILMYGDEPEIIDGTELAADFTFSGLQKFGQGLEERLRGVKIPTKLLEKVNIVEIPGILEVRKQVSRVFPFNDACQWFIDRADIIFLIYDPSKLDVGPETEAILDQLKGREHQTRIVLNKADQVKPEELMRVQGALIWNISPLMSSPQPPIMYTASLWSKPYETWAPIRLLQAQERAFLRDLRSAIDKRIENKIASARRFAVRVRNHAKMVDCYLTTYYNHKSVFGNRKQVADEIIEHPQDYHIYEGLSTLTNISRYDLPDPDVYRDFFKLNPLYEFQQLSATCTYFRGCPINRLDVAIAYDLPELVGTYKKLVESALAGGASPSTSAPGS